MLKDKCNHCKGSSVDITLCDLNNVEIEMPTEFEHFGVESYRNYYNNLSEQVKSNALLLENTMKKYGFIPNPYEWWQFDDSNSYDVIREIFD